MKISRKFLETMNLAYAAVFSGFSSRGTRVPTGKALRNPEDPVQAERIQQAAARREKRLLVAFRNHRACVGENPCLSRRQKDALLPWVFWQAD